MDKRALSFKNCGIGKKGVAIAIAFALSVTMILTACSSNSMAGESPDTRQDGQVVTFEVTVELLPCEGEDFDAQKALIEVPEGSTAWDALNTSKFDVVASEGEYGMYVTAIEGLENDADSAWVYTVNGQQVMEACDSYVLSDGDSVEWAYTAW